MISNVFDLSFQTLKQQFKSLTPFIILLVLIGNIGNMAMLTGVKEGSGTHILYQLLEGLLMTWMEVALLLRIHRSLQKDEWSFGTAIKEGLFNTPAYILYAFIFSLLLLLGLAFLIVPGLYVLVIYSLAPTIAILDPDCFESYFAHSKRLVQESYGLIISLLFFEVISLVGINFLPMLMTKMMPGQNMGIYLNILASLPKALLSLYLAALTIQTYQALKNAAYYREEPED